MPPPEPSNHLRARAAWVVGGLIVAAFLAVYLYGVGRGSFGYSLFTDRDLTRAGRFFADPPMAGAEMSGGSGARVPGPALGVLFGLPMLVSHDAPFVFSWVIALSVLAVVVVFVGMGRALDPLTGAVAAVLFGTAGLTTSIMQELWNPALLPLPMASATLATVLAVERRSARWLPLWAASVALGMQVHMSVAAWALPTGLALLWVLRDQADLRRQVALALAAALASYAPYVAQEIVRGGLNTSRMLDQEVGAASGSELGQRLAALRATLGFLCEDADGQLTPAGWLPAVAGGLMALGSLRRGREDDVVRVLALGVLVAGLVIASSGVQPFFRRHVAMLAAPWAVVQALGVARLVAWAWTRSRAAGAALAVGALALLGVRTSPLPTLWPSQGSGEFRSYAGVVDRLGALRALTGWSLAEVTGRTVWLQPLLPGEPAYWSGWPAVQHLLDAESEVFPGSLPPPCAAWLLHDEAARPWTPETLAARLGPRVRVTDLEVHDQGPLGAIALYTPDTPLCPTTMTQRYVDMPVEAVLRGYFGALATGDVEATQAQGDALFVVGAPVRGHAENRLVFPMGVQVTPDGTGAAFTLWANQLRGFADNSGWYDPVVIEHPRVELQRVGEPGPPVQLDLAPGFVGGRFALTPLTARATDLPAGTYTLTLAFDTVDVPDGLGVDVQARHPVRAVLTTSLAVPLR